MMDLVAVGLARAWVEAKEAADIAVREHGWVSYNSLEEAGFQSLLAHLQVTGKGWREVLAALSRALLE